jgi:hypothetical protein
MAKMQERYVDLRGLTMADAEAKVCELIEDVQDEALANFEIAMIDAGADPDELAGELARQRAELVQLRKRAIDNMRRRIVADRETRP